MSAHAKRVGRFGVLLFVVVAFAAHAVLLFRLSTRVVVPVAAALVVLAVAVHVGAARWILRRFGVPRRGR